MNERSGRWGLALLALGVCVVLLARAREETEWGSRTPEMARVTAESQWRAHSSTLGGWRGALATLPVSCTLVAPPTDLGWGARQAVEAAGCTRAPAAPAPLSWNLSIQAEEPWCYTPLHKAHVVPFTAHVQFGFGDAEAAGFEGVLAGALDITGEAAVTAVGLLSCRRYRERIGQEIGQRVAAAGAAYRAQTTR